MNKYNFLKMSPVQIYDLINEKFKSDWLTWDPETLLLTLDITDDREKDKVLAVQALAGDSNIGCENAVAFENIVQSFNNNYCIVDEYQKPSAEELTYAVKQMSKIIKKVHEANAYFRGEIPSYVAAVAHMDRMTTLPSSLNFATELLDFMNGLEKGSSKYNEYKTHVETVKQIEISLNDVDVDERALDRLESSTPVHNAIRKIIACNLYDPIQDED